MNRTITLLLTLVHFARARWRWHFLRGKRLSRFQNRRARRMVAYANAHSPFYRQHWAGHDLLRWRTLPTVDKRLMMSNFDHFNTAGIKRDEAMQVALRAETTRDFSPTLHGFTVGLSSGTSGHRGIFLASPWEQAAWAGNILSRTLHDLRPRRLRVAFFLRSNSNLYEKIGGLLVQFRFFDLMLPLKQAIRELNTFNPHIVVAPPSLLGFLADARTRGDLQITPERLVSVAEVLEPQDNAHITSAFHLPLHQIYQCTEGLLAVSCKHGSLHIQEDIVAIQLHPLPSTGQIRNRGALWATAIRNSNVRNSPIVTDLWRTTQPIIRYRLNDVLRMSAQPCPCGSTFRVIEAIEGRCDDILYFYSQDGTLRPFFPDTIRRIVLLASRNIDDYIATQRRPGQLHIYLALSQSSVPSLRSGQALNSQSSALNPQSFPAIAGQVRSTVAATLAQYNCQPADLTVENGLPPLSPGTKRRRVIRLTEGL